MSVAILATIASGCGLDEGEPRLPEPRPHAPETEQGAPEPPATGPLVAGGESFASLPIPRGFRKTSATADVATFEGNADAPRLLAYVRERLTRGQLVTVGDGGRFVDAVPKGADPARVKLLVRVVSISSRRSSLQIESQSLAPAPVMSEEQRMRAWQEQLRTLD